VIEGHEAEAVSAAKGEDSEAVVRTIEARGAAAVIPPQQNRKRRRDYDKPWSKERTKVERFINLIKPDRGVATRSEKRARHFRGFVPGAAILVLRREPSHCILARVGVQSPIRLPESPRW
jgi:hypothetical protein